MKLKSNEYYVIKKKMCIGSFTGCKPCRKGTIIKIIYQYKNGGYHFEFILNDKNKKLKFGCFIPKNDIKYIKSLTKKDKRRLVAGLL